MIVLSNPIFVIDKHSNPIYVNWIITYPLFINRESPSENFFLNIYFFLCGDILFLFTCYKSTFTEVNPQCLQITDSPNRAVLTPLFPQRMSEQYLLTLFSKSWTFIGGGEAGVKANFEKVF